MMKRVKKRTSRSPRVHLGDEPGFIIIENVCGKISGLIVLSVFGFEVARRHKLSRRDD